ncbi:spore germination protein KA [Texcoconibacillus texcoconensis]|uniref:Spore germination protein KA n=2 Tax=Texcoconibacillus texcoconensis TaxID=1095777 RepID=A0A840QLQ7_9BACI|nr:spore germination protein KA [Texcoconibacillus texcoconensis]
MIRRFTQKMKKSNQNFKEETVKALNEKEEQPKELSIDLKQNEEVIHAIYDNSFDIVIRPFSASDGTKGLMIYIDGLCNTEEINENVLTPLMKDAELTTNNIDTIIEQHLTISEATKVHTFNELIEEVSSGHPIILFDGNATGCSLSVEQFEMRSVDEPEAEQVVRGPRDGFIEPLIVNTALLRLRIKSPRLKIKTMKIGIQSRTNVAIAYIEEVADSTLIEEAENRLKRIEVDAVLESGNIEEMIEDHPYSPFPQILNTERTDVASSYLLEGHVVILVDGSPMALVAPTTFYSLMQSAEDYYQRFLISTTIRWLRYLFLVIALTLPSLYVAALTYHHEMVPTALMISIATGREQIPFPAMVEAFLMEVIFEVLREAGLRLPKQIGPAVSIVGGLIIGEAAVTAGIVSAPMVIVVAVTGVSSFAIPRYNAGISIRMLRFPLLFLAGMLGLLGIMVGLIGIIVHLSSIRSFGVPYLAPMAPANFSDMKDVMMRVPKWAQNTRPRLTGESNKNRQSPQQKPSPERGGES